MGLTDRAADATRDNFNPPIPCGMGQGGRTMPTSQELISIHPSRVGWDQKKSCSLDSNEISIHPSRVGWDDIVLKNRRSALDFNPPIPCGMGHAQPGRASADQNFNPPIPCGMGRRHTSATSRRTKFQSTHPVWDGTRCERMTGAERRISIHPSRVGWDDGTGITAGKVTISIHPSRVGWDLPTAPPTRRATISIHPSRVGWDNCGQSERHTI